MNRTRRSRVVAAALALALWTGACATQTTPPSPPSSATSKDAAPAADDGAADRPTRVDSPADLQPFWLAGRAAAQRATKDQSKVFRGFQFVDRQPASGIDFVGRVTDDSGKTFKQAHYDHGCGLAVADVDGDGLTDLYFVRQIGENELWRNRGDGTFENITASAGVGVPGKLGISASFADIDNDGDPDLYATVVKTGNVLFENDGRGHFTDITAASGLGHKGHSAGALFFDYDRDGRLDLFLANVGQYTTDEVRTATISIPGVQPSAQELAFFDAFDDAFGGHLKPERTRRSLLFHNDGDNRFTDVSDAMGLVSEGWTGDASVVDGNDDGWPDLYVLNMQGNDGYFENQEGKSFVARREAVFPKTPWGAMGIKVFDVDNDGRLDVYVTDMHSDMSREVGPSDEKFKSVIAWPESYVNTGGTSIFGNALFMKRGKDQYAESSDAMGAEMYWPWGLSVGDLNADGFGDAFVTGGMGYPLRYGVNSLLINDGGQKFLDSEFILGVEPRRDGRVAGPQFELDCSGADKDHRECALHEGRIEVWGALSSRSTAIFDLEGDGDLDIVTNELNDVPMVLVSDLAQVKPTTKHVSVRLQGSTSNRDGLGAQVTVVSGQRRLLQVNDGNTGYLSHGLLPLYFGLDGGKADAIDVTWPSGKRQTVEGPFEDGKTVVIQEPAGGSIDGP